MFKMQTPTPAKLDQSAPIQDTSLLGHTGRSATSSDSMVGRRIKDMRRRSGLTQKQIAGRIGVSSCARRAQVSGSSPRTPA